MLKSKIGYSRLGDGFESGKETGEMAVKGVVAPKLGMVYCSCKTDPSKLVEGLKISTGTIPLIGCTSSGMIMVPDGIITSEAGYSGMMIIDDPDMRVSVAGMAASDDARGLGKKIALEAIKKSGTKQRPSYMYMVASPKEEEEYLQGIQDVIGRVPLFGGSAADDTVAGDWKIICNDQVFSDGCAVAFFYTDKKIVTEYTGAYVETNNMAIITKVKDNRTLVELDGTPALEKYANWRGMDTKDLQGMNLLSETVLSPLGVKDPIGNLTVVRHPMVGNEDNSMNIGNKLVEGTCVVRLESSVDNLINSTKEAMVATNDKLAKKAGGYFLVHCGGRKLGIGERIEEVYNNIKSIAGDTPFIVIFTFGEYGYRENSANMCGGLMLSFTGFAEE